ncbi:uncharacterized protein LOC123967662 isoform X2 [Micropterus dolomieu]|uniref:uncharacterized protein LOC123967662 isoform X2 n=1 Tax=Micropterus dolomieu TaxID=147949 RepID=UPI001E8EB5A1|nr:uncharacterized protein LOC123967662 isoform X2 [Micropterus dolomieu]
MTKKGRRSLLINKVNTESSEEDHSMNLIMECLNSPCWLESVLACCALYNLLSMLDFGYKLLGVLTTLTTFQLVISQCQMMTSEP